MSKNQAANVDWEDKYHRLYDEHKDLKKAYNDKEDTIIKLQAKIRKLEVETSKLGLTKGGLASKDEENLIGSLKEQINGLKAENNEIVAKNSRLLDKLDKQTKEIMNLKRIQLTSKKSGTISKERPVETEINIYPGQNPAVAPITNKVDFMDGGMVEIARNYKGKYEEAEKQIALLREEIARLGMMPKSPKASKHGHNSDLEAQLRDTTFRLQHLQTQYDYIVAKTQSQGESYANSEKELQEAQQKVRELRRTLEELRNEKDISDAKAAMVGDLDRINLELRRENKSLEEKISRLCDAPFISDAFGQHDARLRLEELIKEREDMKTKIDHLQEAVRTHFSALTSLKQQAATLRQEKDVSEKKAEELRVKLQEVQLGSNLMQDNLRLYGRGDDVDMEMLERALTLVKRRTEALDKLPFLEDPDGESLVTIPGIKRKLEEYMRANLELVNENTQLELMIKNQQVTNRELIKENEALRRSRDKDKQELQQKADNFEEIALKRLNKIQSLEAQLRQYVYSLTKSKVPKSQFNNMIQPPFNMDQGVAASEPEEADYCSALLAELREDKGDNIRPDDNLMEIWIKGGTIRDGIVTPGSSTFIVIDFFDFESQTTSLISGSKPQWDFAATYKLKVDDFLMRYFATDVITLELNMATQGDFSMLARCTVPVNNLLKSIPKVILPNYPMLSVKTGQIIANVTLEIRLAIAISDFYRLFLERHPIERAHIEEIATKRLLEATTRENEANNMELLKSTSIMNKEDESRLYNELEIIIHSAKIEVEGNEAPTAYVHFQFLGHPDKFTNPVPNTSTPNFNEKFAFPMVTNDSQLRLLSRNKLQLTLVDLKGEEISAKNEGMIGDLAISLSDMAEGIGSTEEYNIKNPDGKKVAELKLSLKWKLPLKKQRELGPRALSGTEVEILISSFSFGEIYEGFVEYNSFCRFIDPPEEVLKVMDEVRLYCNQELNNGFTPREVFVKLFQSGDKPILKEHFVQQFLRLKLPSAMITDFDKLYDFIDNTQEGYVTIDKILAIMNLDDHASISYPLQMKLRERARDIRNRGRYPIDLFKEADQWGGRGLVSRLEFKNVLKQMGFNLVDEPEPVQSVVSGNYVDNVTEINRMRGNNNKDYETNAHPEDDSMLNDTMTSEDNILLSSEIGIAAKHKDIVKQEKDLFEEKRMRTEQYLAAAKAKQAEEADRSPENTPSVDVLNVGGSRKSSSVQPTPRGEAGAGTIAKDPYQEDHRVSISRTGAVIEPNDAELNASASKLQARFRGHITRKNLAQSKDNVSKNIFPEDEPTAVRESTASGIAVITNSSILDIEDKIYQCFKSMSGNQPIPDFASEFQKVAKSNEYVSRKQFIFVLGKFPVLQLEPQEKRVCSDFFEVSDDKVDYNAFLRFVHYREPQAIPAIQRLHSMVFGKKAILKFRQYDSAGTGVMKRSDMTRCLTELGYGQISQTVMESMLGLFELKVPGQVYYPNFVEYVRDNELSQLLDTLQANLYRLFASGSGDNAIRDWYNKIDVKSTGRFSVQNLFDFLNKNKMQCPKELVAAMFNELDSDQQGVQFSRFNAWIQEYEKSTGRLKHDVIYSNLNMSELQNKAFIYINTMIANAGELSLENLSQSFAVYDWKQSGGSGLVPRPLFVRGARRTGLPFTINELKRLSVEFKQSNITSGDQINYKKFLAWVMPPTNPRDNTAMVPRLDVRDSTGNNSVRGSQQEIRNPLTVIKFLEKKLQSGVDLIAVFGKYDTAMVGRISSNDFCAALSDLGRGAISRKEALEVAERFRACSGDFILYRKIVTELLRQIDEITGAGDVDIVDILRNLLVINQVDIRRFMDVFDFYDRQKQGTVHRDELPNIFETAKMKIRGLELDAINDKFGSGNRIQYRQLIRAIEQRMGERVPSSTLRGSRIGHLSEEISVKLKSLFETLIIRGKDYRGEFDRVDTHFTGAILQREFRDIMLERFNSQLSNTELEMIEKVFRYGPDPRQVNFVKLIHYAHPRNYGRVSFDLNNTGLNGLELWEVEEELRQKIRRKSGYTDRDELKRSFTHFAKKHKMVRIDDFALGVRNIGMRLTAEQEKGLFEMINISGNKGFTFNDYVVFVCDPQHNDVIWKLRRLVAKSRIAEREMTKALNDQDTNASGYLTVKQFIKAMKACSIELSESDTSRLLLRFDTEGSQRFDIERFSRFLMGRTLDDEDEGDDIRASTTSKSATTRVSLEQLGTRPWEDMRIRIEEKLDIGFTPNEIWGLFDPDHRGTLDTNSIHVGARELGVAMTKAEVRSMLRKLTQQGGGPVTRHTFFEAFDINIKNRSTRRRDVALKTRRGDEYDDDYYNDDGRNTPRSQRDIDSRRASRDPYEQYDREYDNPRDHNSRRSSRASGGSRYDDNYDRRDVITPRTEERFRSRRRASKQGSTNYVRVALRKRVDLLEYLINEIKRIGAGSDVNHVMDDLYEAFAKADFDKTDAVGKADFAKILTEFGIKFTRQNLERDLVDTIADKAQPPGKEILYNDFIDTMVNEMRSDSVAEDVVTRLRNKFSREAKNTGVDIEQVFTGMDRDGDGEIDIDEFEDAMERFGIPLNRNEAQRIITKFSNNGKSIRFKEFARAFNTSTQSAEEFTQQIISRIRNSLFARLGGSKASQGVIKRAFEEIDTNRNGSVSPKEFKDAMKSLKIDLSDAEVTSLFKKYDTNHDGSFSYSEFIRLLDLSSVRETDSDVLIKRIRNEIENYLGPGSSSSRKIKEVFAEIDYDKSNTIDRTELVKAMKRLRVDLTSRDVDLLFERFDHNKDDNIDYNEFLQFIDFSGRNRDEDSGRSKPRLNAEAEDIVNRIRRKLEEYLGPGASSTRKIKETFAEIDTDRSNSIDKSELSRAMKSLRVELTRHEIEVIFDQFDHDHDNRIDYSEFLELIDFNKKSSNNAKDSKSSKTKLNREAEDLIRRIRRSLEKYLGPGASSTRKIKETFAEIDTDRSNSIDKSELSRAMSRLRVDFSRNDADIIFEAFDRDGDNHIDYNEFLQMIDFNNSDGPKTRLNANTEELIQKIRRKLEEYLGPGASSTRKIKETFAEIDTDRSNSLDKRELARAMKRLKVELSDRELEMIFDQFDHDHDNRIDYSEFLELIDFNKKTIDNDRDSSSNRERSSNRNEDTDNLMRRIRRSLEDYLGPGASSTRKMKETFAEIDTDRSNSIDKSELTKAMRRLKVDLTAKEVDMIFDRFDQDGDNRIGYNEFLEMIDFNTYRSPRASENRDRDNDRSSNKNTRLSRDSEAIIKRIRRKLEEYLGPGSSSSRKIKETFAEIDTDRSNSLDKRELTRAMKRLKVELDDDDIDKIFDQFDHDHDNRIDYKEFLELIDFTKKRDDDDDDNRGSSSRRGRNDSDTDDLIKKIRRSLEEYLGPGSSSSRKIKETFAEIDTDRSNSLDKRELTRAMRRLKVELSDRELELIFDKFDHDHDNRIDYKEFLELIDFTKKRDDSRERDSRDRDRDRDSSRRGRSDSETDDLVKRIRRTIENYLGPGASSTRKMKETFAEIDADGSDSIDKSELVKALRRLKVDVTDKEVGLLFDRFDRDGDNRIGYKEFLELVDFNNASNNNRDESKVRSGNRGRSDSEAEDVIKRIRRTIENYLGPGSSSTRKIKEVFAEIDADGSNSIDRKELSQALRRLKVALTERELEVVFDKYDRDGDNRIGYKEFLELVDFNNK